ncbi:MAG: DNA helicase RecQ [Rhodospirillaceae bacterium]|nr:DNA helicase RecQ [Rhodospirillaceae bacterium]
MKSPQITQAKAILRDTFGYERFRQGQEEIIASLLNGTSILAVMPTGSGKSLCFQIPALIMEGLTVVVSPLVALMEDQVAALRLAGVQAETINSSRTYENNSDSWRRVAAGTCPILYISPERLMTERMLIALSRLPMRLFAIDEAHCISRWGSAFRPEYQDLQNLKDRFPNVPVAALTATADASTRTDIAQRLFGDKGRTLVSGFDRSNIRLSVKFRNNWKRQILDFVDAHQGASGIIYCLSRRKTEEMAAYLSDNCITALPYHAGMEAGVRKHNQDRFMTEPGLIIVATIAFGMGIDKPDVRFVLHANLPSNIEAYYQEIGRAGRDGAPAESMMLYGEDDIRMRRMFIDDEDTDMGHKQREHVRLDSMIAFCETPACRRSVLLSYFGEDIDPCGNCDTCLDPPESVDGTEQAKQVITTCQATGQVFGKAHLIDILRGARTKKVQKFKHDRLPTYGIGGTVSKDAWRSLIRQMVSAGLLDLDIQGHGGLNVTPKGEAISEGRARFEYRLKNTKTSAPSRQPAPGPADLNDVESELFFILKELRLRIAQDNKVPPYVIFPDKTLADMARRQPRTPDDFAQIHGVGQAKLEKFSNPFLTEIVCFLNMTRET